MAKPTLKDNEIAEKILTAFNLYPNYPVASRGPAGLLMDVLKLVRPDLHQQVQDGEEAGDVLRSLTGDEEI